MIACIVNSLNNVFNAKLFEKFLEEKDIHLHPTNPMSFMYKILDIIVIFDNFC